MPKYEPMPLESPKPPETPVDRLVREAEDALAKGKDQRAAVLSTLALAKAIQRAGADQMIGGGLTALGGAMLSTKLK